MCQASGALRVRRAAFFFAPDCPVRGHRIKAAHRACAVPVKTAAGRRGLPLLSFASEAFVIRREVQAAGRLELGRAWLDNGLVFTTRTGCPVEPGNLVRSLRRICDANGLRVIKVHHLRHTTATLLKNLGVPARDAQLVLGHSRMAVTLEISLTRIGKPSATRLTRSATRSDATRRHCELRPMGVNGGCQSPLGNLGNWRFDWRAWQDSNPRPAA